MSAAQRDVGGAYFFCSPGCLEAFESEPQRYAQETEAELAKAGDCGPLIYYPGW